jgi:hypothetical protein
VNAALWLAIHPVVGVTVNTYVPFQLDAPVAGTLPLIANWTVLPFNVIEVVEGSASWNVPSEAICPVKFTLPPPPPVAQPISSCPVAVIWLPFTKIASEIEGKELNAPLPTMFQFPAKADVALELTTGIEEPHPLNNKTITAVEHATSSRVFIVIIFRSLITPGY